MKREVEITPDMDLGQMSPLEMNEEVDEKAKSKAQQRFFGMVRAVQKGELDADEVGSSVAKAAKTMKKKDVKDFAETKHKNLPNHVKESHTIGEDKLMSLISESIKNVLSERYTSWEEEEFRQQRLAARKRAKELAQKRETERTQNLAPIKKNKAKLNPVVAKTNADSIEGIIDDLKNRFLNQGKEMSGDASVRAMQQFMRYTDRELSKKNIAGGSIFTETNRTKFADSLGEIYDNVQKIRVPVLEIAYILKNTKKFDNQHLEQLMYKLQDLCENIPLAVHEILHHPAVLDAIQHRVPFWVGANEQGGGHNIGLRQVLKQFEKDIRNQTYKQIANRIDEFIKNGKDPMSYVSESVQSDLVKTLGEYEEGKVSSEKANQAIMNLANSSNGNVKINESQLKDIIRESLKEILKERESLNFPEYAEKYNKENGEKLPDDVLRSCGKKWEDRFHERNKIDGKYRYTPLKK